MAKSIDHRAYDHDLVGVSPDYDVRVSPRRLEDEDGPMLDLLKTSELRPGRTEWKLDSERLASRFDRYGSQRFSPPSEDAWQVLAEPSGRQP